MEQSRNNIEVNIDDVLDVIEDYKVIQTVEPLLHISMFDNVSQEVNKIPYKSLDERHWKYIVDNLHISEFSHINIIYLLISNVPLYQTFEKYKFLVGLSDRVAVGNNFRLCLELLMKKNLQKDEIYEYLLDFYKDGITQWEIDTIPMMITANQHFRNWWNEVGKDRYEFTFSDFISQKYNIT